MRRANAISHVFVQTPAIKHAPILIGATVMQLVLHVALPTRVQRDAWNPVKAIVPAMACVTPIVNNMIRVCAKARVIQHVREMNATLLAHNMCHAMKIAPTMILLHAAKDAIAAMVAA